MDTERAVNLARHFFLPRLEHFSGRELSPTDNRWVHAVIGASRFTTDFLSNIAAVVLAGRGMIAEAAAVRLGYNAVVETGYFAPDVLRAVRRHFR